MSLDDDAPQPSPRRRDRRAPAVIAAFAAVAVTGSLPAGADTATAAGAPPDPTPTPSGSASATPPDPTPLITGGPVTGAPAPRPANAGTGVDAAAGDDAARRRGTPLPGGRPRFVVSVLGGSFNAYWVRLAEYTFTAGRGGSGTVRQSYWMWHQSHFSGNAAVNKVRTGYVTTGCRAACPVRTPRGFQPGSGPMGALDGRYHFDRYGRVVIQWSGRQVEAWSVRSSHGSVARMTLHHTTIGGLVGDALGSRAPFSAGATRDQVAATPLTGVQRVASYGDGGRYPVRTSLWNTDVVGPMQRCRSIRGRAATCLFTTNAAWRTAIVVPRDLGRRAFWEHQKQGSDGDRGACFGPGGGHTVALLQAIDDRGRFAGFVGAEASFNGRVRHNAVIGELILT